MRCEVAREAPAGGKKNIGQHINGELHMGVCGGGSSSQVPYRAMYLPTYLMVNGVNIEREGYIVPIGGGGGSGYVMRGLGCG